MMRDHDNGMSMTMVIGVGVLLLVAAGGGFFLGQSVNHSSPMGNSSLLDSDRNFIAVVVGNAVLNYSDAYCEKKGLKSDLLPQTINITDAQGNARTQQYYVPVCVP